HALSAEGYRKIVGYEANGGFLQQDELEYQGRRLSALATRDALLPIIALLIAANGKPLSALPRTLPQRFTASDRLQGFPTEDSRALLERLSTAEHGHYRHLELMFGDLSGKVAHVDLTDGLRATFSSTEVIHLRPSGNAPELRCYTEANSSERATTLTQETLQRVASR